MQNRKSLRSAVRAEEDELPGTYSVLQVELFSSLRVPLQLQVSVARTDSGAGGARGAAGERRGGRSARAGDARRGGNARARHRRRRRGRRGGGRRGRGGGRGGRGEDELVEALGDALKDARRAVDELVERAAVRRVRRGAHARAVLEQLRAHQLARAQHAARRLRVRLARRHPDAWRAALEACASDRTRACVLDIPDIPSLSFGTYS